MRKLIVLMVLISAFGFAVAQEATDEDGVFVDTEWTCPEGFEGQTLMVLNWGTYIGDYTVADFEALHLVADGVDDARRVGAGDVIGRLVYVEGRDRLAERGPDAVVVDARGHHHDQHVVAVESGRVDDFDLHRLVGLAMPLAPDRPGVHLGGHMAHRRNLADLVEVLDRPTGRGSDHSHRRLTHRATSIVDRPDAEALAQRARLVFCFAQRA